MSTPDRRAPLPRVLAALSALLAAAPAWAGGLPAPQPAPHLGRAMSPDEVARWDIDVMPDGHGLPPGRGTVAQGAALYARHCAACHGPKGEGASADELAGGRMPLDSPIPDKTIGSYWPYATTLFDFIRRSMPMNAPGSLSDGEVYALTAFLLHLNGIVGADAVMDAERLAAVRMPNRDGFVPVYRPRCPPPR